MAGRSTAASRQGKRGQDRSRGPYELAQTPCSYAWPFHAKGGKAIIHVTVYTCRAVNHAGMCRALRQAIVEARGGADGDLPFGADPLSPALARAPSGASVQPPSPPPLLFQYQRPPSGASYGVRYAASSPRPGGGGGDASGVSSRSHSKRTSYSGAAVAAVAAALAGGGGDRASRGSLPGLEEGGQGLGETWFSHLSYLPCPFLHSPRIVQLRSCMTSLTRRRRPPPLANPCPPIPVLQSLVPPTRTAATLRPPLDMSLALRPPGSVSSPAASRRLSEAVATAELRAQVAAALTAGARVAGGAAGGAGGGVGSCSASVSGRATDMGSEADFADEELNDGALWADRCAVSVPSSLQGREGKVEAASLFCKTLERGADSAIHSLGS